jgi:hypothetical protein
MLPTLLTLAIILCFVLAAGFGYAVYREQKKQKEEKGFIIIGSVLLFVLFPSAAFTILGIILLCVLLKILF